MADTCQAGCRTAVPRALSIRYRQRPSAPRRTMSLAEPSRCTCSPSGPVPSIDQSSMIWTISPATNTRMTQQPLVLVRDRLDWAQRPAGALHSIRRRKHGVRVPPPRTPVLRLETAQHRNYPETPMAGSQASCPASSPPPEKSNPAGKPTPLRLGGVQPPRGPIVRSGSPSHMLVDLREVASASLAFNVRHIEPPVEQLVDRILRTRMAPLVDLIEQPGQDFVRSTFGFPVGRPRTDGLA